MITKAHYSKLYHTSFLAKIWTHVIIHSHLFNNTLAPELVISSNLTKVAYCSVVDDWFWLHLPLTVPPLLIIVFFFLNRIS